MRISTAQTNQMARIRKIASTCQMAASQFRARAKVLREPCGAAIASATGLRHCRITTTIIRCVTRISSFIADV